MDYSRVASRYVKALLNLAVEQNALETVHSDMQLIDRACHTNHDFLMMLKSPIILHGKKKEILEALFKNKVSALTLAILGMLTNKNRESLLPTIAQKFHQAFNQYQGVGMASVTTTFALDEKLKNEIEILVKKLSSKNSVELEQKINKDLIGGFILNVGDYQIDASIKHQLQLLKVKFSENAYSKQF